MNSVPATTSRGHTSTFRSQAKPVEISPAGPTRRIVRTLERMRCGLALFILAGGLAGAPTGLRAATSPDPTVHLTATLVAPADIALEWTDASPAAAGHIVEYATEPNGAYIILNFCPPGQTKYTHANLMPQTTFYYRVRAIYGPASDPVEVALPGNLTEAAYEAAFAKPEDYTWAGPKTIPDKAPVAKQPIRDAAPGTTAPTNLNAAFVRVTVSGIQLTWTNHSSDEEGFLLEEMLEGSRDFKVGALIPARTNAYGWALKPPERKAFLRIRAFYYGTPSNLVSKTTMLPEAWKSVTAIPAPPSRSAN